MTTERSALPTEKIDECLRFITADSEFANAPDPDTVGARDQLEALMESNELGWKLAEMLYLATLDGSDFDELGFEGDIETAMDAYHEAISEQETT
jgi:hypothetical protein